MPLKLALLLLPAAAAAGIADNIEVAGAGVAFHVSTYVVVLVGVGRVGALVDAFARKRCAKFALALLLLFMLDLLLLLLPLVLLKLLKQQSLLLSVLLPLLLLLHFLRSFVSSLPFVLLLSLFVFWVVVFVSV